jgi:FdrA protein
MRASGEPGATSIATLVRRSAYHDSVTLLEVARELRGLPGVDEAAALMATPANRELLAGAGLLSEEAAGAGPNDLVIAIRVRSPADADAACTRAERILAARRQRQEGTGRILPRTLDRAWRRLPGANLALISVPGPFAASEARRALSRGLHVMLFSDNVPLAEEVELKQQARRRGLLLMGPDCGTAYLAGVPLGFANEVPRGRVGVVAASGTGLQQVATLLAAGEEGISHAIGVGGRDMGEAVGGVMTLAAIDALTADTGTEALVVIGKPPASSVRAAVTERLRAGGKPAVACLLGPDVEAGRDGPLITAVTLEDAASATIALLHGTPWPRPPAPRPSAVPERVEAIRRSLGPGQRGIRGLYAGGTLAEEARLILARLRRVEDSGDGSGARHDIIDLGAEQYTMGRAHPMLDPTARVAEIARAGADPATAVILLDMVLGHGAAVDPAGDVAPALAAARDAARGRGSDLAIVACVVGTPADPQGLDRQIARLERAGAWVLSSNAQAVRAAAWVAVRPEPPGRAGPGSAG